jgi:hypothetical protein
MQFGQLKIEKRVSRVTVALIAVSICVVVAMFLWSGSQSESAQIAALQREAANLRAQLKDREHTTLDGSESSRTGSTTSMQSFKKALETALEMPRSFDRTLQIEGLGYHMAGENLKAALEELGAITDYADRASFIRGIFTAAAQLSPELAIQAITELPQPSRIFAMRALATAWFGGALTYYPARGVAAVADSEAVRTLSEAGRLAIALAKIGTAEREAATLWADRLLPENERPTVLGRITSTFTPARIIAMYSALPETERPSFQQGFVSIFTESPFLGLEALQKWPEDELRTAALVGVTEFFATSDDLAPWAYTLFPQGAGRAEAITALTRNWFNRNPQAATEWANSLVGEDAKIARDSLTAADQDLQVSPSAPPIRPPLRKRALRLSRSP